MSSKLPRTYPRRHWSIRWARCWSYCADSDILTPEQISTSPGVQVDQHAAPTKVTAPPRPPCTSLSQNERITPLLLYQWTVSPPNARLPTRLLPPRPLGMPSPICRARQTRRCRRARSRMDGYTGTLSLADYWRASVDRLLL